MIHHPRPCSHWWCVCGWCGTELWCVIATRAMIYTLLKISINNNGHQREELSSPRTTTPSSTTLFNLLS